MADETKAAAADKGQGEGVSRRDVLRLGLFGTAVLFLAQIGGTFASFFWPRKVGAFGGKINIGHYSQYPPGSVTRVDAGKFYLVHYTDGLLAIYWRCTHLGCTVPWDPNHNDGCFCCNCHGSQFAPNGDFIAGPAPRPLDLFPVEIDADGNVIVDTGTVIQREDYSPDQATPVPS
ncbi:MAG TPA: Rieske 2Fe-2S domain-containing protein [Bacillota bacterium]